MRYLITGGCGFLGSNLGARILASGEELAVLDNMSRAGCDSNLAWLQDQGELKVIRADIRSDDDVQRVIRDFKPEVIFHLAGQVAMSTSIENPRLDFEVNAGGSVNVLEAVRQHVPECVVLYSSTNKVFGDLEWVRYEETETRYVALEYPRGFDETLPLEFHSPYGCSKGSADQYMLDYARIFGLRTAVFRHSSMYGGRQFATYDQGWIGWFCQQALEIEESPDRERFTISGNGKQVRDLLHADDCIDLYIGAAKSIDRIQGRAFCIGGGADNSFSLLELFAFLEGELGIEMAYEQLPPRASDQKVFIADNAHITECTGWSPRVGREAGVRKMLEWNRENRASGG